VRRLTGNLVVGAHLRGQKNAPFLTRDRIEAIRDRRVRRIVRHAVRTVPYYRALGIDPREIRSAKDLDALPLLEPQTVRADPDQFLSRSRRGRNSLACWTSGSFGRPLEIHHDRRSVLANIAYGERERAPVVELCGSFRPRELHLGFKGSNFGRVLDFYASNTRLPVKPRRDSLLMVSPFEEIVAAINDRRPELLTGYATFLDQFFRTLRAKDVEIHVPKVVMAVGEPLPRERRRQIEHELGTLVMSRYCAVESFKIGYFCGERTGFHLHEDLCHLRVLAADGREAAPGEAGEVVISNLVNHATVLLNYRLGDVAAFSREPCPCGRTHRMLSAVHGRVEDMLPLVNGDRLDPDAVRSVFADDREVLEYQLVQHEARRFELKLMTADERAFSASRDRAVRGLRPLLGPDAVIDTSRHTDLGRPERERTGKFRLVGSHQDSKE
jgi:phenylacetate-CoA ligase